MINPTALSSSSARSRSPAATCAFVVPLFDHQPIVTMSLITAVRSNWLKPAAFFLTFVGASSFIVACSAERVSEQNPTGSPVSAQQVSNVIRRSVIVGSLPRTRFMAEIHTAAVHRYSERAERIKKMSRSNQCVEIDRIVREQLPAVSRATGVSDAKTLNHLVGNAMRHIGCSAGPMALLGAGTRNASVAATSEYVTGAYENYTSALEAAIDNASNPIDASQQMSYVLSAAQSEIPAADYEVLSGLAQLGFSSLAYWEYYFQSGGGGSGGGPVEPMALFVGCNFWCKTGVVGKSDLVGAVAGAAGVFYSGGAVAPGAVLAGSVITGAATSIVTAIGLNAT